MGGPVDKVGARERRCLFWPARGWRFGLGCPPLFAIHWAIRMGGKRDFRRGVSRPSRSTRRFPPHLPARLVLEQFGAVPHKERPVRGAKTARSCSSPAREAAAAATEMRLSARPSGRALRLLQHVLHGRFWRSGRRNPTNSPIAEADHSRHSSMRWCTLGLLHYRPEPVRRPPSSPPLIAVVGMIRRPRFRGDDQSRLGSSSLASAARAKAPPAQEQLFLPRRARGVAAGPALTNDHPFVFVCRLDDGIKKAS